MVICPADRVFREMSAQSMPQRGPLVVGIARHWSRNAIYHSHIARSPQSAFDSVFPNTLPL
jgi:hypothetical protein